MGDRRFDAVIVGAGLAGLYSLHRLRALGLRCCVLERASGVGGTWWWNRYPGARCDVPSIDYSYSFSEELEQEWRWTERYATQPEILRYIEHVADRFDLRRDIRFETTVAGATWEEGERRWHISTTDGDVYEATFFVVAAGCLSVPHAPDLEGLESFEGRVLHTATWPHEPVDLTGSRVAVFGTGSSGIQVIPVVAEVAEEVVVYQRTPNFTVPARNAPLDDETYRRLTADYRARRRQARTSGAGMIVDPPIGRALDVDDETRLAAYEGRWAMGGNGLLGAFTDLLVDAEANATAAEFVRRKIREIVEDPETAALLAPTDHPIGTKRICLDTDYYATFNRENVSLVDLRVHPVERITPTGVRTADGERRFDTIVFATGFDAVTGALLRIDIAGAGGARLRDEWVDGPRTYLGLMSRGFPNLFMITGPQSPSVRTNMMVAIEQHVEWIADCLGHLRQHGIDRIEPAPDAQDEWIAHNQEVAEATLFLRADSWYVGSNIPGKPRVPLPYLGGLGNYGTIIEDIAADGYRGFELSEACATTG